MGEEVGRLEGGEMTAPREESIAADVAVGAFSPLAWAAVDGLGGETNAAGAGDFYPLIERLRVVPGLIIVSHGGVDRLRGPVERHVGEKFVLSEASLYVAAALTPGAELLDDPGRQPGG